MKRHLITILIISFLGLIPAHLVMAEDLFVQEKKLVRLEESWSGEFGSSISMDGDTVAVGAPRWNKTENCCSYGAVFIYYRNHGGADNWGEVKKIVPTGVSSPGNAYNITISGDTLVVGYLKSYSGSSPTAVYIFYRHQGGTDNWGQVKKITGIGTNSFGSSVALEDDIVIVGDPADTDNGSRSGAAYVFYRHQGGLDNWGLVKKITPGDGTGEDSFGGSVAIDGNTFVAGAIQPTANVVKPPGKAYIFERDHGGIDNWGEVKKIVAGDGEANDRFGNSVSISGDAVAVGSLQDDDSGSNSGSAYVFYRNQGGPNNWGQINKIVPGDGEADDRFGNSVSISGDAVAIGASGDDDMGLSFGSAYVFYRNQGGPDNWGQITKFFPDHRSTDKVSGFGGSVFILEDTLVVGSPSSSVKGQMMGMSYIFERDSGDINNWLQKKYLFPVDTRYVVGDRFGKSVSIDGDTIAAGAYLDDEDSGSSGAAYIFERDLLGTSNWGQYRKKYIGVSTNNPGDYFGWSVSLSSGTLITGAYGDDDMGTNAGAAYISERSNEGGDLWGYDFVKKLLPSDGAASDYFGYAVAINGDMAVVGAYQDDDNGLSSGAAYIFQRDFGGIDNWGQVTKITPSDGAAYDYFGYSVAIIEDIVAVGSYQDDDNGSNSGSVYVFRINQWVPGKWEQVKKITPDDGAAFDYFGKSISLGIAGELIVGATGDDDNGSGSGSAYIFEWYYGGEDNWGQVNKLTASDGAASDSFGCSVSSYALMAVVGACQDDDRGSNSGSAYVFMRRYPDGTATWMQEQKLTASDGAASDNFGEAVSINSGTIVIGASSADDFGSSSGSVYVWGYDGDGDTISDHSDNCVNTPNPDQADSDKDGVGDVCDQCADTPAEVPVDDTGCPLSIVTPGDCNGDDIIDAGDLTALVLEIFDGDGNVPADAPGGTFAGTAGADANEDGVIDAGDLTCTVLTIFNGPGACEAAP